MPANQRVPSGSPRFLNTFPFLSHIFRGFNFSPKGRAKILQHHNKYRHMTSFLSKGCFTKDGLTVGGGNPTETRNLQAPRTPMRFPVLPCQRGQAWTLQAQLLRPYQGHLVPSPRLLDSGVASKRLKWMEKNFKVGQLFLSFPLPGLIQYLLFISVRPHSKTDGWFPNTLMC